MQWQPPGIMLLLNHRPPTIHTGIDSHGHGGWEVPWQAVCELEFLGF